MGEYRTVDAATMNQIPAAQLDPQYREPALKIAFSLLRKWRCQLQRDDVEGMVGVALVRAAKQFDPNQGTKFESFLYYYVKAELISAIEEAVSAQKAIVALREANTEFNELSKRDSDSINTDALLDPDRIAASASPSPEGRLLQEERSEIVRTAISQLEETHQRVLTLVFFDQLQPHELKESLGLTRSGLRRALSMAKKALAKELRKQGFEYLSEE